MRASGCSRGAKPQTEAEEEEDAEDEADKRAKRPGRPEVEKRRVVASRRDVHSFGPLLAATACAMALYAAPRRAFVADGLAENWSVYKRYFSRWTAVLETTRCNCLREQMNPTSRSTAISPSMAARAMTPSTGCWLMTRR